MNAMEFQLYQTINIFFYLLAVFIFWKIKKKNVRIAVIILAIALFLINPFKFKTTNISGLERREFTSEKSIPERVYVHEKSFEEKQKEEMDKLKRQSREAIKNETD